MYSAILIALPFALLLAMNTAAETTRLHLIEKTWPACVTVRKATFMKAALTTRGAKAMRRALNVAIYDRPGRAHLALHDKGGVKVGKCKLAVLSRHVKRAA